MILLNFVITAINLIKSKIRIIFLAVGKTEINLNKESNYTKNETKQFMMEFLKIVIYDILFCNLISISNFWFIYILPVISMHDLILLLYRI